MAPPHASNAIPPVLPPSVEEAYRRKCIQLRARTQTVADANDAARIRLLRMRRGIEKMRLERAFLLEQVARRVKPNDDSSDGSPSPPPTPKQKPLRVKRGRRAPDFMASEGLQPHASQDNYTDDGHLDNGAHHPEDEGSKDALERDRPQFQARLAAVDSTPRLNTSKIGRQKKPEDGFDVFANELFGPLSVNHRRAIAAGNYDVGREILAKWHSIGPEEQAKFNRRFRNGDFAVPNSNGQSAAKSTDGTLSDGDNGGEQRREDVDMAEDDVEDERD